MPTRRTSASGSERAVRGLDESCAALGREAGAVWFANGRLGPAVQAVADNADRFRGIDAGLDWRRSARNAIDEIKHELDEWEEEITASANQRRLTRSPVSGHPRCRRAVDSDDDAVGVGLWKFRCRNHLGLLTLPVIAQIT